MIPQSKFRSWKQSPNKKKNPRKFNNSNSITNTTNNHSNNSYSFNHNNNNSNHSNNSLRSITAPSAQTRVTIGNVVLIKNPSEGIGVIRYIDQNTKMVGVELTDPIGTSDGNGYFHCRANYGIFVIVHDILRKVSPEELLHKVVVLNHVTRTKYTQLLNANEANAHLEKQLIVYKEANNDLQLQVLRLRKTLKAIEIAEAEAMAVELVDAKADDMDEQLPIMSSSHRSGQSVHSSRSRHSMRSSGSYHHHSHSHSSYSSHHSMRSMHSHSNRMDEHRPSEEIKPEVNRLIIGFSPEPEVEPIECGDIERDDSIKYEIDSSASPAFNPTVQQLSGFLKNIPKHQLPKLPNELIQQITDIAQTQEYVEQNIQKSQMYPFLHRGRTRRSQKALMVDEHGVEMSEEDTDSSPDIMRQPTYHRLSSQCLEEDEKQYIISQIPFPLNEDSSEDVAETLFSIDDSRNGSRYISPMIIKNIQTLSVLNANGNKVRESLSNSAHDSSDGSISSDGAHSALLHPRTGNGFADIDKSSPEMHTPVVMTSSDEGSVLQLEIDDPEVQSNFIQHMSYNSQSQSQSQSSFEHSHSRSFEHNHSRKNRSNHSLDIGEQSELGRRIFTDHYKHFIDSSNNSAMYASFEQRGKLNSAIKNYVHNFQVKSAAPSKKRCNSNVEEVAKILRKLKEKQDANQSRRKKPALTINHNSGNSGSGNSNNSILGNGGFSNNSSTRSNGRISNEKKTHFLFKNMKINTKKKSIRDVPQSARDNTWRKLGMYQRRVSQSTPASPRTFQALNYQVKKEVSKLEKNSKKRRKFFLDQMDKKLEAAAKKLEKRVGIAGFRQYTNALASAHKHPQMRNHKFSQNFLKREHLRTTVGSSVSYAMLKNKSAVTSTRATHLSSESKHNFSASMDMRSTKLRQNNTAIVNVGKMRNTLNTEQLSMSTNASRNQQKIQNKNIKFAKNMNDNLINNSCDEYYSDVISDDSDEETLDDYLFGTKKVCSKPRMSISLPSSPMAHASPAQYTFESLDLDDEDSTRMICTPTTPEQATLPYIPKPTLYNYEHSENAYTSSSSLSSSSSSSIDEIDEPLVIVPETPKFQSVRQRRLIRDAMKKRIDKKIQQFQQLPHQQSQPLNAKKQMPYRQQSHPVHTNVIITDANGDNISHTQYNNGNISKHNRPLSGGRRRRVRTGRAHRYRRDRDFSQNFDESTKFNVKGEINGNNENIMNDEQTNLSPEYSYVNNHSIHVSRGNVNNNGRFRAHIHSK